MATASDAETPDPAGPFFGRSRALRELEEKLRPSELVDVVGAPGVGKSALAREFIDRRRDSIRERWLVVEGDRCREASDLVAAIAEEASVEPARDVTELELANLLGSRLESRGIDGVLLDNATPLLGRPELVERLVSSGFAIHWLATTRSVIEAPHTTPLRLGALETEPSVAMYRQTSERYWLGSDPLDLDDGDVRKLVEKLGCHPTAIETAAARINVLSPEKLRGRLERADSHDRVMDVGAVPALEQLLSEAWRALESDVRRLLEIVSAFAGPASLEAIESLYDELDRDGSPALLAEDLVQSGWLQPREGTSRGRTLELPTTLKSFARARLRERDSLEDVVERHAESVLARAQHLERVLVDRGGPERLEELDSLAPELFAVFDRYHDTNPQRAAEALLPLRWTCRLGELETPVRTRLRRRVDGEFLERTRNRDASLLSAFAGELEHRANRTDSAADRTADALRYLPKDAPVSTVSEVYLASSLPLTSLDPQEANRRLERALEAAERSRRPVLLARARERLAFAALDDFELEKSREEFNRARALLAEADNRLFLPSILTGLGYVAHRLDMFESARNAFREAIACYESSGRASGPAAAHFNLGALLLSRGESDRALDQLRRSTALLEAHGRPSQCAASRIRFGLALHESGAPERAKTQLRDALSTAQRAGDRHNQALAEGVLTILRGTRRGPLLDLPLRDLQSASAPDAAAAFLAYSAVCYGLQADAEEVEDKLVRLDELEHLLGPKDVYLAHVVRSIRTGCLTVLREIDDDLGPDPNPAALDSNLTELDNPLGRLVGRAFEEIEPGVVGGGDSSRIIPAEEEKALQLRIHQHGHWFTVDGDDPVDLTSRGTLRRLLAEIVAAADDPDRRGATVDELIEAGWPEATPTRSSGANRVYYSIRKLRDLGLDEILVTGESGYCFAETTELRISTSPYDEVFASAQ